MIACLFWGFVGLCVFCILFAVVSACDHWIESFPTEEQQMTHDAFQIPKREPIRFVTTFEGESLETGIRRAFILSQEYDTVCLVHDKTAVMVVGDSTPYSIESEWKATRKLQNALKVCEGR